MIIRIQQFGPDDPNEQWPPEILNCRSVQRLDGVRYRLVLTNGDVRTISGDLDIEEILPDGTPRPLP
jgi:hypothetical protein